MIRRLLLIPLFVAPFTAAFEPPEIGSYKNPHPRLLHSCDNTDIAMLAACSNQVLAQLNDCKANDLACECCALQSMDPKCNNLCPGDPNANFLTVMVKDCADLNDVNACNLPFKKNDGDPRPQKFVVDEPANVFSVKSQLLKPGKALSEEKQLYSAYHDDSDSESDSEEEEDFEPPANNLRPLINIIRNHSNVTGMSFTSPHTKLTNSSLIRGLTVVFFGFRHARSCHVRRCIAKLLLLVSLVDPVKRVANALLKQHRRLVAKKRLGLGDVVVTCSTGDLCPESSETRLLLQ